MLLVLAALILFATATQGQLSCPQGHKIAAKIQTGAAYHANNKISLLPAFDAQNNSILAGTFYGFTIIHGQEMYSTNAMRDIIVIKKNTLQQVLWIRRFGSLSDKSVTHVRIDKQDNIIVSGIFFGALVLDSYHIDGSQSSATFVLKLSPQGTVLWAVTLPNYSLIGHIALDANNDIYGTGYVGFQQRAGIAHYKLLANGTIAWKNEYYGDPYAIGKYIEIDEINNKCYFAAHYQNQIQFQSIIVQSPVVNDTQLIYGNFNCDNGSVQWVKTVPQDAKEAAVTLHKIYNGFISVSRSEQHTILRRLDDQGIVVWKRQFFARCSFALIANGNIYVTGFFGASFNIEHLAIQYFGIFVGFVAKFDMFGNVLWLIPFGQNSLALLTPDYMIWRNNALHVTSNFNSRFEEIQSPPQMLEGTIAFTVVENCQTCRNGTFSLGGIVYDCNSCPIGSYASQQNSSSCQQCQSGTFMNTTGAQHCYLCDAGTFSSAVGANSSSVCQACDAGYYSASGAAKCTKCDKGSFSASKGSASCNSCPKGTYGTEEGATSATMCKKCPIGTFSSIEGATSIEQCTSCAKGTYSTTVGASSSSTCQPCAIGSYSNLQGASSCNLCPIGSYSFNFAGAIECTWCDYGTYSNMQGSTSCIACPQHTFGTKLGATSISDCQSCPLGTYSKIHAAKNESVCKKCPPGSFLSASPNHVECKVCAAGYYTSEFGAVQCIPCKEGTFTNQTGTITCTECAKGFGNSKKNATFCEACQIGYYNNEHGSECKLCPHGKYSKSRASLECETCPQNAKKCTFDIVSNSTVIISASNNESNAGATLVHSTMALLIVLALGVL